jgi:hypothetical protein
MNFNKDLKKVMILYPEVEVQSSDDYVHLINIHNIVESAFDEVDESLIKEAFNSRNSIPLKNPNDYFYLVFKSASNNNHIKKFAYPLMFGLDETPEEFDIEKWGGLVHKIYDAVYSGDMNLQNAIDYYAGSLDEKSGEDDSFKKWLKYYQDGEHLKYSEEDDDIKKEAFQFPLSAPGFYPPENGLQLKEPAFDESKEKAKKKMEYSEWKSKLYAAIRRIDKLLRQSEDHIDTDVHRDLADLLHSFDQEVRGLRHEVTASDLAYKYANKFKKRGFSSGSDVLRKYSQEAAPEAEEMLPDDFSPELENREDVPEPADIPIEGPTEPVAEAPVGPEGSLEKALSGESGARAGEYEALAGEISLHDAVIKLEEIAGRLADRRTIRLLAEFDIMLDKIGIAPMFPELAEAQSKLIDGYSYALTRVTKMLGMLSSGKSLVEISDAKTKDLTSRTMKEVNKTLEPEPEAEERGTAKIQEGLEAPQEEATIPAAPAAEPEAAPGPEELIG